MDNRARRRMKGLVARVKNSNALRRVLMPLLIRYPAVLGRAVTLAQRFAKDITHPDWPGPLPAAYLHLPLATRKVLLDLARAAGNTATPALPPSTRSRLAWVTPHAPDAAEAIMLGQLAHHYAIELVVLDAGAITDGALPVHSGAWFAQHGGQFARIVYQVANTASHGEILGLLARHPGIVVLHDFALGEAVAATPQAVLHAHGYSGLTDGAAALPLNRIVFDHADGILVDPDKADTMRTLAQTWYGPRSAASLHPAGASADAYAAAIEAIATGSAAARYRQALRTVAAGGIAADPRNRALIATARALAASQPAWAPRQLLVDISAVVLNDMKTGIQRVVRSILLALIKDPPAGFRVEPVYASGVQRRYRYARRFTHALLGFEGIAAEDDPIAYQDGDMYLGLDLSVYSTLNNRPMLDDMRSRGVDVNFVVYDILPLLQPHAFLSGSPRYFGSYILAIGRHADGVVCISRAVADELAGWLDVHGTARATPLKIGHFHLGADLDASAPSRGMPADADHVLASMAQRPSFLMVGTLEPRKAHAQALAAFDLLWQGGADVNLVIVGKEGWLAGPVAAALRAHPQLGKKLFWLQGVSDEMLTAVYGRAAALLAASLGEGFGLPLIEAAQHGLPIIARGLPVFREVSGAHAFYFDGTEPAQLAGAITQWLDLFQRGLAPPSAALPWLTWAGSARQLVDVLVHGHWYRTVTPAGQAPHLPTRPGGL
jgi:glycosyltransferase involved in cell wall biosynthesis